ncbi:MAG: hypothetical protein ACRDMZ_05850 [Solirubrobacteraceae bacterium]
MSSLAIRRVLLRRRRQLALAAAIMALGAVIALHHSTLAMGDMHHGMDAGGVAELCLGVFAAVGAAVVAIAIGIVALGRWRPVLTLAPATLAIVRAPAPRGRDGPALLHRLCVCRR